MGNPKKILREIQNDIITLSSSPELNKIVDDAKTTIDSWQKWKNDYIDAPEKEVGSDH